jgi:glycerophosphoryl diester phosphodiesterase
VAKQLGAKWVEFDVMLTQDSQLVVIHDMTVNRTTDGVGKVSQMSYEELSKLDAGSWFGERFSGESIPTLEMVINSLTKWNINANVEIKPAPGEEIATTEAVLQTLHRCWDKQSAPPLLSSFSLVVLEALKRDGCFPTGMLLDTWDPAWKELAERFSCYSVHVNIRSLTPDRVAEIKKAGFKVLAYTVNDAEIAETVLSWGVSSVFSDCPDSMLSYISK